MIPSPLPPSGVRCRFLVQSLLVLTIFLLYVVGRLPAAEPPTAGELDFLKPVNDLPPSTIITSCEPAPGGKLRVRGVTLDNGEVATVTVNNLPARPLRTDYANWEAFIPEASSITAKSNDAVGNEEKPPHVVSLKH
ncbi:hypothetical protein [Verrucomicrobium spinosum]|uniref:hypothetical protein n=1 Tax=Verrucomicrobium spinosum TaxID=2736 RepID=UPI0001745352|nr:hypothetical protein [Verrucomicrobium spinosum]